MTRLLVVDDENNIRKMIRKFAEFEGYEVYEAVDGMDAVQKCEDMNYDCIIMDIMMPNLDGFSAVKKIHEFCDTPVIMLSAKSEEFDKVTGLNIGADDYVTKPFAPMELLARVNSQLRRYSRYMKMADRQEEHLYTIGGLELNEDTVQVSVDGEPVSLTPLEFKILALLMRNPGRVFSAEEIYERVWQEKAIATETIMVHIRNIRQKIEVDPKNPKYLKVVWGVGYKIEKQ